MTGMESVLIIGGAGFIGSRLARLFVERGYRTAIFDSFQQFADPLRADYSAVLRRRFEGLREQLTVIRGDARYRDDLANAFDKVRPDRVVHLAALPIAKMSNIHVEEALASTVGSTANLLQVIRDAYPVRRFVYTSSSMVYGDFEYTPADERHPRNPKGIYGGVKLAGEDVTRSFAGCFGIPWAIVRPSAVYGPDDVNGRVSQLFVERARRGEVLQVKGGAATMLDFTFVDDAAEGLFLAATHHAAEGEVFNITRGEGRSLVEYTDILRRYYPNLKVELESRDASMPIRGSLCIDKARTLLGYQPQFGLEDGIAAYVGQMQDLRARAA